MSDSTSATAKPETVLPPDHWFHRFIDADSNSYGRSKGPVMDAIFAFAATDRSFPKDFDSETPDGWFLERIERMPYYRLHGYTPEEKARGWVDIPIAWKLGCLWDAVYSYTNSERPRGPGKRYDSIFSFQIKILKPAWDCLQSILWPRTAVLADLDVKAGIEEWNPRGLSPWEIHLKAKEAELFRVAHGLDAADLVGAIDRLCLQDVEFHGYLHCLRFSGEVNARIIPDKASRQALSDAVDAIDRVHGLHDREERSEFTALVDNAYFELLKAWREDLLDEVGWRKADDVLQAALRLEPHGDLPEGKFPKCRGVLDVACMIKNGAEVPSMLEACRRVRQGAL